MNSKKYTILSLLAFGFGMLLCALHYEWIVIRSPLKITSYSAQNMQTGKKETKLFFWQHNKWHQETHTLLWSNDVAHNISQLITALLNVLDDEHLLRKKIGVESVALTPSGMQAYISFDHNPLPKDANVHQKWLLIESILKTMRENGIKIQDVQFLVYHEPLSDYHLDFNQPWPLNGFLSQK
jgi:hypothetical protein